MECAAFERSRSRHGARGLAVSALPALPGNASRNDHHVGEGACRAVIDELGFLDLLPHSAGEARASLVDLRAATAVADVDGHAVMGQALAESPLALRQGNNRGTAAHLGVPPVAALPQSVLVLAGESAPHLICPVTHKIIPGPRHAPPAAD